MTIEEKELIERICNEYESEIFEANYLENDDAIKNMLSEALSTSRKELREKIEGMKIEYFGKCTSESCTCKTGSIYNVCENQHNITLNQILALLEETT